MAALRVLFAIVMAFALTLAPLAQARAMNPAPASTSVAAAEAKKPHCHKTKQQEAPRHFCCCGDHGKSRCPDAGCACLLNCGAQSLVVFTRTNP